MVPWRVRACATQNTMCPLYGVKDMGIGVSIVVSLLLAAATVIMHYELLQFASTLARRLTVPTRPRIIIVIGVVLAAHIFEASLYAAAYYVLQTHFGVGGLVAISKGTCSTTSISRWPPTRRSASVTCIQPAPPG